MNELPGRDDLPPSVLLADVCQEQCECAEDEDFCEARRERSERWSEANERD